jgi:uncharacterized protein involved in exopolysaccharide biosynthesis
MNQRLEPSPEIALNWPLLAGALVQGRWTVGGAVLIALILGSALILLSRPLYTAETTLQIDREAQRVAPLGEPAAPASLLSGDEYFQTQYGLLRGRALATRVSAALGLDRDGGFVSAMGGGGAAHTDSVARSREVMRLLRGHYEVAPGRGSRLVTLRFSSPDPDLSARIAGAFADAFVKAGLERRLRASTYARTFLEGELTAARIRLESSERGLAGYAAAEGIITLPGADGPGPGRSLTADSLEAFNGALAGARTDRILAEARLRQSQTAGPDAPEVLANPTVQQISQDRARLAAEYQDRLRVFKPDYPDMRQLKARIDETDRQLELQTTAIIASLQARYGAARSAEAALAAQVGDLTRALVDLRGRSIRYTILQREVDTNRVLYDGLLQRYRDVGVAGGVIADNIAIVDPATPPDRPSWPRPAPTLVIAGLIGLMTGVAAALGGLRPALAKARFRD